VTYLSPLLAPTPRIAPLSTTAQRCAVSGRAAPAGARDHGTAHAAQPLALRPSPRI